ncbi:MAG: (2E,6E)-farnesyl diphosphate synthase [Steroidobacteraceae bacterium]
MSVELISPWAPAAARDSALAASIEAYQQRIERALDHELASEDPASSRLCEAMRYSVLGGGKRLRPVLVYLTGHAFGAALLRLDAPAAAVELIHAYSLIHDDLPAMDDDDLRRGRPSCHRAFDEGTAILAGDALQALAFAVLAQPRQQPGGDSSPEERVLMLATLARAIGTEGMAGGQAIDLEAIGKALSAETIERMHRRKTGALIQASVELGAITAGLAHGPAYPALRAFGAEIGLAFQIQDDILDVTGETSVIGKKKGADAALGKPTYPSVFGLEAARSLAVQHRDRALVALDGLGAAALQLRQLAYYVVDRAL